MLKPLEIFRINELCAVAAAKRALYAVAMASGELVNDDANQYAEKAAIAEVELHTYLESLQDPAYKPIGATSITGGTPTPPPASKP